MRVFQALCVVLLCLSAARASQLATDVSLQTEVEFPSLSDLVDDCVNKVKSKFDSTVSSVQSTCTTSLNNAVNGLNSDISSIQSTALNAINSIPQNAISSLKKSVSDNVVTPINSALQRISDLDTNIKNKMAAAANDLTAVGNAIKKVAATIASFLGSPLLIDDPGTNCQVPPFITQINTYVKATVISTNAYCWFAGMAKKLKIESLTASLATVSIANKGTSLMEIDSTTGELVSSSAELQADDFNCDAATGVADQLEAISDVFCNVLATVDSNGDVTVQPKIAFVGACFRMSAGILKAICAAQGKY